MSYEDAPATRIMATHCMFCQRPLLDAESVTAGMGPICRQRVAHVPMPPERREALNRLIWTASATEDPAAVAAVVAELACLGATEIVERLEANLGSVRVVPAGSDRVAVVSPYREDAVAACRRIPGRRWDSVSKVNTFPVSSLAAVGAWISEIYPTTLVNVGIEGVSKTYTVGKQAATILAELAPQSAQDAPGKVGAPRGPEYLRGCLTIPEPPESVRQDLERPYRPECLEDRQVLAQALAATLEAAGFTLADTTYGELVYELPVAVRADKPEAGHRVRVYTSVESYGTGMVCRAEGQDAIRVLPLVTFWSKRTGYWSLGAKKLAKISRVNRTGTIGAILERMMERVVDAWAAADNDVRNRMAQAETAAPAV